MSEKTCIVIPCYNEAGRLNTQEFLRFTQEVGDIDFCFVNDGSSDDTRNMLQELCKQERDRLLWVDYGDNRGKAEAVRVGINHVLGLNDYKWIGFADADLATPLCEIKRLAGVFNEEPDARMVMGSRIKRMGVRIERKLFRHYMGRMFATIVAVLFRLNAYDTQCGAKIFDRITICTVFDHPFISRWLFDIEILLRIKKICPDYNQIIKEIPLMEWLEQGGSKIRFMHLLRMPLQLGKIYFRYKP